MSLEEELVLFYHWTIVSSRLFLCSCIVSLPLRSLIIETCSRANTVARLRSQNALSQKWLLMCQGEEGDRGWDGLDGITDSIDMSFSKFGEIVKDREAWYAAVHGVTKSQTQLSDWTTNVKKAMLLTSLEVQWLRVCLPVQGTWIQSLVQEDPTCHRATKPTTTESLHPRVRALQEEKPLQ